MHDCNKPHISIVGTNAGKIRARVEVCHQKRYEVHLGSPKWYKLDYALRDEILEAADKFATDLVTELERIVSKHKK